MYKVVSSGSSGNAVIYHNSILVDCGVPYSALKPFIYDLQLVLLTHVHGDHINKGTIRRLAEDRPTLRFGCCEWMVEHMEGVRNVDVYEIGKIYNYVSFSLSPIQLYHDVKNCGYRIFKEGKKIIHATDTATMEGISAKGYDLYAIECNYDEEKIFELIDKAESNGEFAYQRGALNSHLSWQKAHYFFHTNKKETSELLRLHESKNNI